MSKAYDKEYKLLMRKNPGRCSICKEYFDLEEYEAFTVVGYDERRKLQITAECCEGQILVATSIGIIGHIENKEEFNESIKDHPLYDYFYDANNHFIQNELGVKLRDKPEKQKIDTSLLRSLIDEDTEEDFLLAVESTEQFLASEGTEEELLDGSKTMKGIYFDKLIAKYGEKEAEVRYEKLSILLEAFIKNAIAGKVPLLNN